MNRLQLHLNVKSPTERAVRRKLFTTSGPPPANIRA
jgi:hypothetical protein